MTATGRAWSLVLAPDLWRAVRKHLRSTGRPGAGVVLVEKTEGVRGPRLLAREFLPALYGIDHVPGGPAGYHALSPEFVRDAALRARRCGLAYLAVHRGRDGAFTAVELASHERGYPALLRIVGDLVGAVVFGRDAAAGDLWLPDGSRAALDGIVVPARTVPSMRAAARSPSPVVGDAPDHAVATMRVGIVGESPAVDVLLDLLVRLGVRVFAVVGDVGREVAGPSGAVVIAEQIGTSGAVQALERCDWIFLAGGGDCARYLVNGIVHRCLIPAIELPIAPVSTGSAAGRVRRPRCRLLQPGRRCLWCDGAIDPLGVVRDRGVSAAAEIVGDLVPPGSGFAEVGQMLDAVTLFVAAVAGRPPAAGRSRRGRRSQASRGEGCRMCAIARSPLPAGSGDRRPVTVPPVLGLATLIQDGSS